MATAPRHDTPPATCAGCCFFCDDREQVERELTGLTILSSAYGDCWGNAGICTHHRLVLLPFNTCDDFAPRRAS